MENQVSDDNPPCKEPFKAGEVRGTDPVMISFSEPQLTMGSMWPLGYLKRISDMAVNLRGGALWLDLTFFTGLAVSTTIALYLAICVGWHGLVKLKKVMLIVSSAPFLIFELF